MFVNVKVLNNGYFGVENVGGGMVPQTVRSAGYQR